MTLYENKLAHLARTLSMPLSRLMAHLRAAGLDDPFRLSEDQRKGEYWEYIGKHADSIVDAVKAGEIKTWKQVDEAAVAVIRMSVYVTTPYLIIDVLNYSTAPTAGLIWAKFESTGDGRKGFPWATTAALPMLRDIAHLVYKNEEARKKLHTPNDLEILDEQDKQRMERKRLARLSRRSRGQGSGESGAQGDK